MISGTLDNYTDFFITSNEHSKMFPFNGVQAAHFDCVE